MVTTLTDSIPPAISPAVLELARSLAKEFSECLWFWHPDATVDTRADAYLVIRHLREYGGHRAWRAAQGLWKCL